jgi:hypothetical protein
MLLNVDFGFKLTTAAVIWLFSAVYGKAAVRKFYVLVTTDLPK